MPGRLSATTKVEAELIARASLRLDTHGPGLTDITAEARRFVSGAGAGDGVLDGERGRGMAQKHQQDAVAGTGPGNEPARLGGDVGEARAVSIEPQARARDQVGFDLGRGGQAAGHGAVQLLRSTSR